MLNVGFPIVGNPRNIHIANGTVCKDDHESLADAKYTWSAGGLSPEEWEMFVTASFALRLPKI